ncbi:MAG: hypothetical protein PHR81_09615 [Bacteroidales bacterium]|nr:hypothetical protein [Bacteroidales bacterium]MDD4215056.1 hypothetical protein [Bacteroidales bacterium]
MKKLIVLLLIICVAFSFNSCKKSTEVTQPTTNSQNISPQDNLFDNLILKGYDKYKLTKFSEYLLPLNIKEIDVLEIMDDHITFQVFSGDGELIVNADKYLLDKKVYKIIKTNDSYIIYGEDCSTDVKYNFVTKDFFVTLEGQETNINKFEFEDAPVKICSDFIILSTLLHEFVMQGLVHDLLPNFGLKYKYQGTAVGFHLNHSDSEYWCNHDYKAILAAHPGWFGTGVTISCIWEGLLCMCTANFYSN